MHRLGYHLTYGGIDVECAEGNATASFIRGPDGKAVLEVRNVTPPLETELRQGPSRAVAELCRRECELHTKAMSALLSRFSPPDPSASPVRVRTEAYMQLSRGFSFDRRVLSVDGDEHVLRLPHRPTVEAGDHELAAAMLLNVHKLRIRQVEALYRRILETIVQDRSRN